jgi:hypothetical protein
MKFFSYEKKMKALLKDLKKRKTDERADDVFIRSPAGKPKTSKPDFGSAENKLIVMEPKEIEWWIGHARHAKRLRPGHRLGSGAYPLSGLLPAHALAKKKRRPVCPPLPRDEVS